MGLRSWYTRRDGSSNLGGMRLLIRTSILRRFLQLRIIYFKRNHLRIIPSLFPRCLRFNPPGKERMPRHSPNHLSLQCYLPVHPHTPHEPTDMGFVPYPGFRGIHPNHLCLQSTLTTARLGVGFRFIRSRHFCELLGIQSGIQDYHGRIQEITVRTRILAGNGVLDWSGKCPGLWEVADQSIGIRRVRSSGCHHFDHHPGVRGHRGSDSGIDITQGWTTAVLYRQVSRTSFTSSRVTDE